MAGLRLFACVAYPSILISGSGFRKPSVSLQDAKKQTR